MVHLLNRGLKLVRKFLTSVLSFLPPREVIDKSAREYLPVARAFSSAIPTCLLMDELILRGTFHNYDTEPPEEIRERIIKKARKNGKTEVGAGALPLEFDSSLASAYCKFAFLFTYLERDVFYATLKLFILLIGLRLLFGVFAGVEPSFVGVVLAYFVFLIFKTIVVCSKLKKGISATEGLFFVILSELFFVSLGVQAILWYLHVFLCFLKVPKFFRQGVVKVSVVARNTFLVFLEVFNGEVFESYNFWVPYRKLRIDLEKLDFSSKIRKQLEKISKLIREEEKVVPGIRYAIYIGDCSVLMVIGGFICRFASLGLMYFFFSLV